MINISNHLVDASLNVNLIETEKELWIDGEYLGPQYSITFTADPSSGGLSTTISFECPHYTAIDKLIAKLKKISTQLKKIERNCK